MFHGTCVFRVNIFVATHAVTHYANAPSSCRLSSTSTTLLYLLSLDRLCSSRPAFLASRCAASFTLTSETAYLTMPRRSGAPQALHDCMEVNWDSDITARASTNNRKRQPDRLSRIKAEPMALTDILAISKSMDQCSHCRRLIFSNKSAFWLQVSSHGPQSLNDLSLDSLEGCTPFKGPALSFFLPSILQFSPGVSLINALPKSAQSLLRIEEATSLPQIDSSPLVDWRP